MAIKVNKKLVADLARMDKEETKRYTSELIAELRTSEEGQKGIKAFLEKRKSSWNE